MVLSLSLNNGIASATTSIPKSITLNISQALKSTIAPKAIKIPQTVKNIIRETIFAYLNHLIIKEKVEPIITHEIATKDNGT